MKKAILATVATVALASGAGAADLSIAGTQAPPSESGWELAMAPYVWAAGLNGTVAQFGAPPVSVDLSFGDVMKNFDMGLMAVGEARNGRFGIFADVIYVALSGDATGPLGGTVELDTKTFTATVMLEYRVADAPQGSLDLMAGARLFSVDSGLDFSGGQLDGLSLDDGETWVDPMIGAKGRFNLTPSFYATGWAMVGGFGAASDIGWDVFGGLGYQANDWLSLVAGYRGLGVDYSKGAFQYDVVQHGPVLGGVIRF